jgi:hypothetical protein
MLSGITNEQRSNETLERMAPGECSSGFRQRRAAAIGLLSLGGYGEP